MDPSQLREPTYQQRIDELRRTKSEHTDRKVAREGFFDTDDKGRIPWDESIPAAGLPFAAVPTHPSGGCWGIRGIGLNFRRWLEVHPVYIHPCSAVACAWIYNGIPGVAGWELPAMVPPQHRDSPSEARRYTPGWPANWRPEDRPTHLTPLLEKYHILGSGIGAGHHMAPDVAIGLRLGWGGLLEKLRYYRERNRPADTAFYDGEEDLILGVQTWIRRHIVRAREMAAEETDPVLKQNLLEVADASEAIVSDPPCTLRQACQWLAYFQCVDSMWGTSGGLGQLDELLRPYYEADCAAGRVSDEEVVWYTASLFFNETHYSQIGGQAADGHDLTSKMSYLVLEGMHRLRIPCNIALRVFEGMDEELLRRAVTYMFEDGFGVTFACAKGLDEGFARNGFPLALARTRIKVGCNWTALPGIEYPSQDVTRVSLVKPLLLAFDDVLALPDADRTMETLWARYAEHLRASVDLIKLGRDLHMERQSRNYPEIVINLFCYGTLELGLDVAEGGVSIVDLSMDGVGLATAADSFAAIEQRVAREGRLTWDELATHLRRDFAGAENVRLMLNNVPRYGHGGTRADDWAMRIGDLWSHAVHDEPTPNGWRCIPGLFSHGNTNDLGRGLPATPNGRHAGAPISHNADPDPGFVPGGLVAATNKFNAVAAVQPKWGNTTPLQIEMDKYMLGDAGGVETVMALIMTHNAQFGTLINMNVLSKEDIIEAHRDPLTHPDLVIRVTGYSAYFRSLSREYRQPIVDRILAEA